MCCEKKRANSMTSGVTEKKGEDIEKVEKKTKISEKKGNKKRL